MTPGDVLNGPEGIDLSADRIAKFLRSDCSVPAWYDTTPCAERWNFAWRAFGRKGQGRNPKYTVAAAAQHGRLELKHAFRRPRTFQDKAKEVRLAALHNVVLTWCGDCLDPCHVLGSLRSNSCECSSCYT